MSDSDGIKLMDLKVIDLKNELEKRKLDRTGVKSVLLERLKNALQDEGHDPGNYIFNLISPAKLPSNRRSAALGNEQIVEEKNPTKDVEKMTTEGSEEESSGEIDINGTETTIADNNCSHADDGEQTKEDCESETETELKVPESNPNINDGNELEDSVGLPVEEGDKEDAKDVSGDVKKIEVLKPIAEVAPKMDSDQQSLDVLEESQIKKEVEAKETDGKKMDDKGTGNKEKTDTDSTTQMKETGLTAEKDKDTCKGMEKDSKEKSSIDAPKEKATDDAEDRSLWIRNLRTETPAIELKKLFSQFGKVARAKVVVDTRLPVTKCYGYVTMSTVEAAETISNLHDKLKIDDYVISVKKATNNPLNPHSTPQKWRSDVRRPDSRSGDTRLCEPSLKRPRKISVSPDRRDLKRLTSSPLSSGKDKSNRTIKETSPAKKEKETYEPLLVKKEKKVTENYPPDKKEKKMTEKHPPYKREKMADKPPLYKKERKAAVPVKNKKKETENSTAIMKEKKDPEKLLPPGIDEDEFDESEPPVPGTEELVIGVIKKEPESPSKTETTTTCEQEKREKEDYKREKEMRKEREREREGRTRHSSRSIRSTSRSRSSKRSHGDRSRDRENPKSRTRIQLEMKKLERMVREEERKSAMERERIIYRRQEADLKRLKLERERLKYEREQIEKERGELLRIEREVQALERERLNREKEELQRQKMKMQLERETKRMASQGFIIGYDSRKRLRSSPRSSPLPERRYESSSSNSDLTPTVFAPSDSGTLKKKRKKTRRGLKKKSVTLVKPDGTLERIKYKTLNKPEQESREVKERSHSRLVIEEREEVHIGKQIPTWPASSSSMNMKPYSNSNSGGPITVINQRPWPPVSGVPHCPPQTIDNNRWIPLTGSMGVDRTVHIMPPAEVYHNLHQIQPSANMPPVINAPTNTGYGLMAPGYKYNQGSVPMAKKF